MTMMQAALSLFTRVLGGMAAPVQAKEPRATTNTHTKAPIRKATANRRRKIAHESRRRNYQAV
jgi:hypothetical protein